MGSLIEKATSGLELVDLSKQNFRRTLESLQEGAHSLLLLTVQWKEIEAYFDSTKKILQERAKELEALEESIKGRSLELETKEKDLCSIHESKIRELEKKEKEIEIRREEIEQLQTSTKRIESIHEFSIDKLKEKLEPLVSLLAKNMGSSVTRLTNCTAFHLKEDATDFADDLVEKNTALARLIPNLDPAKLVLDAIEGHLKEYLNKYYVEPGDRFDSVVNSFIVLLEKLLQMNPKITSKVKQQATQLGIDWLGKAKTNPNNSSRVLGCLLFLAVYDLASLTTRRVLLNLLEHFLLHDQAPRLFRLLRLQNEASGVVETLKKKEEYRATFRFICEFRLFKLFPGGNPGAFLLDYLNSSEKAALAMEAQKDRRDKIKADAVMAFEYITEKKLEPVFPAKILKKLVILKNNESAQTVMEPVHKNDGKSQTTTNAIEKSGANSIILHEHKSESKRQRLTEPITSFQNPTVNRLEGVSVPSELENEGSGVNHQPDAKATYPLSTETKSNTISGFIKADILRELVEKQPLEENDLSNALKCTPDPAKLVLDTSMALSPTNPEGGYEFKLLITSASCFLLLDQLKKLPPQIGHPVKGDAKKLAVYWKDKIIKSKTDDLEVVCFLLFLGIYGIVSEFKADDLLGLLDNAYWRTASPDLCQFLRLENAIPGFIQNLIKTGHRMKAVDYIYSFDMVHRFQPVSAIINDSLRITKESAEKSFRDAMNESAPQILQVAAIDRQIKSLRAAIRCISCHKLESEFQLGNLKEQIKSLLKLRRSISDEPDLTIKEPQTAKPQNLAEDVSVTSNTHLEPSTAAASSSVSKPCSTATKNKKKGKKRSLSGNNESSAHVTSHPNNHFSGHGYSLNQRQTWHVDPYGRSFTGTPNSVYNYNHWAQPEGHQFYQSYYPNPFYRNQS